jgi:hypothetical protein
MMAALRPKFNGVGGAPMSQSGQEVEEGEKLLAVHEKGGQSHSSFAGFVPSWGSFISCWLEFFTTFFLVVLFGVLNIGHRLVSYERILLVSRSPPPPSSRLLNPSQMTFQTKVFFKKSE